MTVNDPAPHRRRNMTFHDSSAGAPLDKRGQAPDTRPAPLPGMRGPSSGARCGTGCAHAAGPGGRATVGAMQHEIGNRNYLNPGGCYAGTEYWRCVMRMGNMTEHDIP